MSRKPLRYQLFIRLPDDPHSMPLGVFASKGQARRAVAQYRRVLVEAGKDVEGSEFFMMRCARRTRIKHGLRGSTRTEEV